MRTALPEALGVLRSGGLIALPTETVYGLGADASNELAVRRIFAVKGRPSSHPLIVHVADLTAARGWASSFHRAAELLAQAKKIEEANKLLADDLARRQKELDEAKKAAGNDPKPCCGRW